MKQQFLAMWVFLAIFTTGEELVYQQFAASTPSKFGILVMIDFSSIGQPSLQNYLNSLAQMDCPLITEISVVWNKNQIEMLDNSLRKIEMYFEQTEQSSHHFRYRLPKESTAEVFYSITSLRTFTCLDLTLQFRNWQSIAIGNLSPLIGHQLGGFSFYTKKEQFKYIAPISNNYYSTTLLDAAWVPRLFLELYNSEDIWEAKKMREITASRNSCDDIAINFLVSHFFPELLPMPLSKQKQPNPAKKRAGLNENECVKQFVEIFGYNPLRIVAKLKQDSLRQSQIQNYSVYLKKKSACETLKQTKCCQNSKESADQPLSAGNQKMMREKNEKIEKLKSAIQGMQRSVSQLSAEADSGQKAPSQLELESKNKIFEIVSKSMETIEAICIMACIVLIMVLLYFIVNRESKVSVYESVQEQQNS